MPLGIVDLLSLFGFDRKSRAKMVRHQDSRYPVDELLRRRWYEFYQAYQSRPIFHKADYVLSFSGLERSRALFQGVFKNRGHRSGSDGSVPTDCDWAQQWRLATFFYDLERMPGFEELEQRVIIDWGLGALAWHQKLSNKTVLEVTAPGRRLPPFNDYLEFSLTFDSLCDLFANENAHPEWRSRLQAVGGVYLILAEASGELYIGSATGAEGIWGRWRHYATTGHGGNELLKRQIASNSAYPRGFRYSILQILPKTWSRDEVIAREVFFKVKLGSRSHGLNLN